MMNSRYVVITLVAFTLMVGGSVASTALAAPSPEHIDAMLDQPVSLYMVSGERWDGALYKRSDGHVVFKGNDGRIQSFAIHNIERIALYQYPPKDRSHDKDRSDKEPSDRSPTIAASEALSNAAIEAESHAAEDADAHAAHADLADRGGGPDGATQEGVANEDEDHVAARASDIALEDIASGDGTVESMDEAVLLEDAEVVQAREIIEPHNAAQRVARNEPIFNALDRYALEEELKALQHKQALKREVDSTSRRFVIGGAAMMGVHTVFQGLLLIPMFTDGGMAPRTAKILSGVNLPFFLLGGSFLATGLVQRNRAQKAFREEYNFSVAPSIYRDGGGAHMRLRF